MRLNFSKKTLKAEQPAVQLLNSFTGRWLMSYAQCASLTALAYDFARSRS
jgi:hypothetical protein